jgi:membrane carboxypeptidase/penicillin-binding protein
MMILPAKMLSKIAVGFMVSQVLIDPSHVKPKLDANRDLQFLVDVSNQNCDHMYKTAKLAKPEKFKEKYFDDDGNEKEKELDPGLDIVTKMKNNDPAMTPLFDFFQATCKRQPVTPAAKQVIAEAIVYYNEAMADLDADVKRVTELKDERLPQRSTVVDSSGKQIAEVFSPGNRRVSVQLADVPMTVRNAILAAEDKNFYTHNGVDEEGVMRAGNASQSSSQENSNSGKGPQKHPVGGSTITQQVIKNVVGNTLKPKIALKSMTDEQRDIFREQGKLREMYLAVLLERTLAPEKRTAKDLILELYLNDIYFSWSTYGINLAAQTYFNKSLKDIRLVEATYLSVVLRCPSKCTPAHPEAYKHRVAEVLANMLKLKMISEQDNQQALADLENLQFAPFQLQASYIGDKAGEAAKAHFTSANSNFDPTTTPTVIHSTINSALQTQGDLIVDEGMIDYETSWGRAKFSGPEKNIADEVKALSTDPAKPQWAVALKTTQLPLYDVPWEPAIVLSNNTVGLRDGRVMSLLPWKNAKDLPKLNQYDVVYTMLRPTDAKSAKPYAELRFRPTVQAAAIVIENRTGKIRLMKSGFSRALSDWNRVVDAKRHPGSAIKPALYLEAFQAGVQPDTLLLNQPLSQQEMQNLRINWNPANNEGMFSKTPIITTRQSLELSENQSTLRLWPAISPRDARGNKDYEKGFKNIQDTYKALGIVQAVPDDKPIILGTLDVSMQDLALFYATIANGGWRPSAQLIESVDVEGQNYPYKNTDLTATPQSVGDGVSFFQLRTILQGVPVRGTLKAFRQNLQDIIPANASVGDYLAAKTGTSSFYRDAWVIGFTRDVTIAVWVGYDGGKQEKGKEVEPPTLGEKAYAATVSGPIFEKLVRAVAKVYPLKPFGGVPKELAPYVTAMQDESGQIEYLRNDAQGQPTDARYLVLNTQDINNPNNQRYTQQAQYEVDPRQLDYTNENQAQYPAQQPYTRGQQQLPSLPNVIQKLFGGGNQFGNDRYNERYRQW